MLPLFRRGASAVVAALALAATARAEDVVVNATAIDAVTIDGKPLEWTGVPAQAAEERPWTCAFAADNEHLYILLRFSDLATADSVLRTGTIIWVNSEGKRVSGFGLRYRGTRAVQNAFRQLEKANAPAERLATPNAAPGQRGGNAQVVRPPLGTLEVLRNAVVNEMINDGAQPAGLAAVARVSGEEFVYEFRVPLSEIVASGAAPQAGLAETIAVGFQLAGYTPAERAEMRAQRRSRSGSPWPAPPPGVDAQGTGDQGQATGRDASTTAGSSRRSQRTAAAGSEGAATTATGEGTAGLATGGTSTRRQRRSGTVWYDVSLAPPAPEASAPAGS